MTWDVPQDAVINFSFLVVVAIIINLYENARCAYELKNSDLSGFSFDIIYHQAQRTMEIRGRGILVRMKFHSPAV